MTGFLLGQRIVLPPDSTIAPYYRPRSVLVRYDAHASMLDGAWDIYRELYSAAAELWGSERLTAHYVQMPVGDAAVIDAWASVGFGREQGWGLRDTQTNAATATLPSLAVRRATARDLDAVFQLDSALVRHEAGSPVFMPYPLDSAVEEWRNDLQLSLNDRAVSHWLAEFDGQPVGLLTVTPPPAHVSPLLTPDSMLNISAASIVPEMRGSGFGGVLVGHALDAARRQGHAWCRTGWMTANLYSSRFWSRQGFAPIAWRMSRVIDERALTG